MPEVTVRNNQELSRYEAYVDGELAGFSEYHLRGDDRIVFTHTEVDDAFEGHGVGTTLVREELADVRRDGTRKVVPLCPFVKAWIARHPDHQDLVG